MKSSAILLALILSTFVAVEAQVPMAVETCDEIASTTSNCSFERWIVGLPVHWTVTGEGISRSADFDPNNQGDSSSVRLEVVNVESVPFLTSFSQSEFSAHTIDAPYPTFRGRVKYRLNGNDAAGIRVQIFHEPLSGEILAEGGYETRGGTSSGPDWWAFTVPIQYPADPPPVMFVVAEFSVRDSSFGTAKLGSWALFDNVFMSSDTTTTAFVNERSALTEARTWNSDARLVRVSSSKVDTVGQAAAFEFTFVSDAASKALAAARSIVAANGRVVDAFDKDLAALPSTQTLPREWLDSGPAAVRAEANSGDFRARNVDAQVAAVLAKDLDGADPGKAVWEFRYTASQENLTLFVDALTGEVVVGTEAVGVVSSFDTGDDGWTFDGAGMMRHYMTGGNPDGFIEFEDLDAGPGMFVAPPTFHGDLRTYMDLLLQFDLKNTLIIGPSVREPYGNVTISSNDLSASADVVPAELLAEWTSFALPLNSEHWGVTPSRWDSVLSDVTAISIEVDPQGGHLDRAGMDNFAIGMSAVDVEDPEDAAVPGTFALAQNYPNPFNPTTTISYDLPRLSAATLSVYDVLGRRLRVLASGTKPPGTYEVSFDATGLPSGVYLYRLQAGDYVGTKRMVVVR